MKSQQKSHHGKPMKMFPNDDGIFTMEHPHKTSGQHAIEYKKLGLLQRAICLISGREN